MYPFRCWLLLGLVGWFVGWGQLWLMKILVEFQRKMITLYSQLIEYSGIHRWLAEENRNLFQKVLSTIKAAQFHSYAISKCPLSYKILTKNITNKTITACPKQFEKQSLFYALATVLCKDNAKLMSRNLKNIQSGSPVAQ